MKLLSVSFIISVACSLLCIWNNSSEATSLTEASRSIVYRPTPPHSPERIQNSANAFFTIPLPMSYQYVKNGLVIGACPMRNLPEGNDKNCRTFEEMARDRNCTLAGIVFNDHTDTVIVYCTRN